MTSISIFSRRIALASAVSVVAIACSPINAQGSVQDTAASQGVEEDKAAEKKGVYIVKRGDHGKGDKSVDVRVMLVDVEGGKPHKIKVTTKSVDGKETTEVEGGELTKDGEGNDVVTYTDDKGKTHEFKLDQGRHRTFVMKGSAPRVWVQNGEHRVAPVPRVPHIARVPRVRAHTMRVELEQANAEIEKARAELQASLIEVEQELTAIEDKDSAEYEGLKIAESAIKSAMESLKGRHFDEEKMQFEFRKMDKHILRELNNAMEDVHEQREIIIDLQGNIQEEVEDAREEMREMIIEIEEMNDGEERIFRLQAIEEMENTMEGMAEIRLEALKKAEEELHKSRIELEKQIADQKAKAEKEKKDGE